LVRETELKKLQTQENQVSYVAVFSRPAFALWGQGGRILDGLFTAFEKRGISLSDFVFDQTSQVPAAQSITVNLSPSCYFKFQLERIESVLKNFTDQDLMLFAEILQQTTDWLRAAVPGLSFKSHLFGYFGHSRLSEGTSKDVLASFPTVSVPDIGVSEGNGIIFHWQLPEREWKIQLTIDHSLTLQKGLFTQFFLLTPGDNIDYQKVATAGRDIMEKALNHIGLESDNGN